MAGRKRPTRARGPMFAGPERGSSDAVHWLLDARELPFYVEHEGETIRPFGVLFMHVESGFVLPPHVAPTLDPDTLREAFALLADADVEPPTHLRVASPKLARWLAELFGDELAIELAPTPEFESVWDSLAQASEVGRDEAQLSLRQEGRIADELLEQFFQASKEFRQARPWKLLAGEPIALELPWLELDPLIVTPVVDEGQGGLMMFFDTNALDEWFYDADEDDSGTPPTNALALAYYAKDDLPEPILQDLRTLQNAPKRAPFPILTAVDEAGRPRPIAARDYEIAITVMRTISGYYRSHRELIRDEPDDPPTSVESVEVCGERREIRLVVRPPRNAAWH